MKILKHGRQPFFRETFLSSVALSRQVLADLGVGEEDAAKMAEIFEERDRRLIVEQHAVQHDEERLIQSARETATELDSLFRQDVRD